MNGGKRVDRIGHADRMPHHDPRLRIAASQIAGNDLVVDIGREPRVEARDVLAETAEHVAAVSAQQRIQDRLVDLRRAKGRRQRRNAFACASLQYGGMAGRMVTERGVEAAAFEIGIARDHKRAPQLLDGLVGCQRRVLVEPFRHHQFGRRAKAVATVFGLDLDKQKRLGGGGDGGGAKPERDAKRNRPLEPGD